MGYLIGRNRTARETYPVSPGAGGGSGAGIVPLTRYRYIDGGTAQSGLDGSVAEPYKTIGQFLTAFTDTASVADANALVVGKVTPSLTPYTASLVIPAYRCIELRADNFSQQEMANNITWANVAGAGTHVPTAAQVILHNLNVAGNITVTDDGGCLGELFLTGDEQLLQALIAGNVVANTTTALAVVSISGMTVAGFVNLGTATTSAGLAATLGGVDGTVTAKSVTAAYANFGGNITVGGVAGATVATFIDCAFSGAPVLTGPAGAYADFDGPSWTNFVSAGGTVAGGGLIVTVRGGFPAGRVPGANIGDVGTVGSPAVLSLNGTNAGATWNQGGNFYTQNTALTANRFIQVALGGGEKKGDILRVVRSVTDANGFHITFEDDTGATIATLASANRGFVDFEFNGTHYVLAGGGGGLT
jgi:hypothetical protein